MSVYYSYSVLLLESIVGVTEIMTDAYCIIISELNSIIEERKGLKDVIDIGCP